MSQEEQPSTHKNLLLENLFKNLDFGISTSHNGIQEVHLKNTSGQGGINYISFNNELTAINIDVNFKEDQLIKIPNTNEHKLYFFYILEGFCYHSFDDSERYSRIDELKTVGVATSRNDHNILIIKKEIPFKCNIITIGKDDYLRSFQCQNEICRQKINKLTHLFDVLRDYLFECTYNFKITEQLHSIKSVLSTEAISSVLQLKSRYQLILCHHVEQIFLEIYTEREQIYLSRYELQKIRSITEHIIDNPGLNHSQDILCTKFFISQSKLQNGFKALHKSTVSNFIRHIRLDKAQELLLNSELNVSEVVYSIGFTSRSYFSKIFKQRFGCNPSSYKTKYPFRDSTLTTTYLGNS